MLSISLPMHGVGHADYYIELAQKDYYTAQGNDPGVWFGRGAAPLGLHGEVESRAFEPLLRGRSPDGCRDLVQNAGDAHRQTAWDLTFSAPKSVSVVWALAPEDVRKQIEAAHQQAVEAALTFLEETTGLTRRGKAGTRMEPADLVFALFPHYSSRASDPQLHTHCLLINLAVRRDGTTGALWSKEFFRAKMAAGAVFQVQLAAGLRERLGLATQPDRIGFQIAGVPKEVCKAFSQRGETIRAILDERNDHDARTAKQVALDTRPHKVNVRREELTARWRATAEPLGWNTARVSGLLHQCQVRPCSQKALEQRFHDEAARLPADKRSPGRLRGLAAGVAVELNADARMFRPLLRFLPGNLRGQAQIQSGDRVATVTALSGRQTETPRHEPTGHTEAGKVADPNFHARPSGPDIKAEAEQTSVADRAASGGRPEQPRPEAARPAADHGRRQTETPRRRPPGKTQTGKAADPNSHARPSSPDIKAKPEQTSTRDRAESAGRPEQPRPEAARPAADHGRRQTETPRRRPPGKTQTGKAADPNSHARPSSPGIKAKPEQTSTRDRAASAGRPEQPRPGAARPAADDGRQQTWQTAAAGPQSDQSRRSGEHHSHQQGGESQRQRQRTEREWSGFARGSHADGQRTRQKQRGRAQPRAKNRVEENAELLRQLDPRQATTAEARKKLFFTWKEAMSSGKADELFGQKPFAVSRRQATRNRQFARAFEDKVVPIPAAGQTRQRLTFHATKLAAQHQSDTRSLYQTLRDLRPAAERALVSVEWRRLFPHAPKWSPARYWKAPVVVLGHARKQPPQWGSVLWQQSFLSFEARVQQRKLFPKAPKWSPAHNWSLPALRLVTKTASSSEQARRDPTRQKKGQDQGQSQSH